MSIRDLITLLRPEQYYKNLVVFLAIYFSGHLLNMRELLATGIGFILLCLISSANYVINDIVDRNRDRYNKEKAGRPIASGKVSAYQGAFIATVLLVISLAASYFVGKGFFAFALGLFVLTTLYSLALKNELFLDIIAISFNYVLRAMAGAAIIGVKSSPWLVVGTFFLALFLAAGKRKSEKSFLKTSKTSIKYHRPLLDKYSDHNLSFLLQMSATTLLLSYALYSFLGTKQGLIFTLPIAMYVILRYLYLLESGSEKVRSLSGIFTDRRIVASAILYAAASLIILYT